MSWDSIDDIRAYRKGEDVFVEFDLADNNMRDLDDSLLITRVGMLIRAEWEVMTDAVKMSANAEGGMLRSNRRRVHAETIIKRFRKAIREAREIKSFSETMWSAFELRLTPERRKELSSLSFGVSELNSIAHRKVSEDANGEVYRWGTSDDEVTDMQEHYHLFKGVSSYYNTCYTRH